MSGNLHLINTLGEFDVGNPWTCSLRNTSFDNQIIKQATTSSNFRLSRQSSDNKTFFHAFTEKNVAYTDKCIPADVTALVLFGFVSQFDESGKYWFSPLNGCVYHVKLKNCASGILRKRNVICAKFTDKGYFQNFKKFYT